MYKTTYPNKVFDYMASGKPVILAIDGVIRQVIEDAGGGIPVPPGDPVALSKAILFLADNPDLSHNMGCQARIYVETHFDRVILATKLLDIMLGMVA